MKRVCEDCGECDLTEYRRISAIGFINDIDELITMSKELISDHGPDDVLILNLEYLENEKWDGIDRLLNV